MNDHFLFFFFFLVGVAQSAGTKRLQMMKGLKNFISAKLNSTSFKGNLNVLRCALHPEICFTFIYDLIINTTISSHSEREHPNIWIISYSQNQSGLHFFRLLPIKQANTVITILGLTSTRSSGSAYTLAPILRAIEMAYLRKTEWYILCQMNNL